MTRPELWKIKSVQAYEHKDNQSLISKDIALGHVKTQNGVLLYYKIYIKCILGAAVFVIFKNHVTGCFPAWRPWRRHQWRRWRSSWWKGRRWSWWGCTRLLSNSRLWVSSWHRPRYRWRWCCSRRALDTPGCWSPQRTVQWRWLFRWSRRWCWLCKSLCCCWGSSPTDYNCICYSPGIQPAWKVQQLQWFQ